MCYTPFSLICTHVQFMPFVIAICIASPTLRINSYYIRQLSMAYHSHYTPPKYQNPVQWQL